MAGKLPLNLSKFKKTSQDDTHATLKHKDGHEIKVALKALSPGMRKELSSMPNHMADGGKVAEMPVIEEKPEPTANPAQDQMAQYLMQSTPGLSLGDAVTQAALAFQKTRDNEAADAAKALPDPATVSEGTLPTTPVGELGVTPAQGYAPPAAPLTPPSPQPLGARAAPPAAVTTPVAGPTSPADFDPTAANQKGLQDQITGTNAEAAALGAQGKAQAVIDAKAVATQQKALAAYDVAHNELETERKAFQQDLQDSHVDPLHYLNSMGTGQRVSTAIGLILGGIGAGGLGQENPAMKFINQQIDRDIAAQQQELGKKNNLLQANLQQFGNLRQATDMTRIMQNDIVANQLKEAADKAVDPIAKARALKAIGELEQTNAVAMSKLSAGVATNKLTSQIQADPQHADAYINAIAARDPKQAQELRDRLVPGMGLANTKEGAKAVSELAAAVTSAKQGLSRLGEINKTPFKSISPSLRAEAETIQQTLVGLLRVPITGPGTLNDGERKMIERLVANPTNMFSLDSNTKIRLDSLVKRLDSSVASTAQANGLKPADPIAALPPQQQAFAKWARENPNDPKAKLIIKKLGL